MKLKTHDRYDYSAITERKDYSWPGGKRLAVHFCLNVEHFSFGEGLGNDYAAPHPQPNTRSFAWRDYGNRVGAWRLLELAEAYDLPYGLLVNTALYDYCPQMVAAFSKRGDEIVGHGRTNAERQADMSLEEERSCIGETAAAIEQHEGKRPLGWLAPYISQTHASLDLLREAGFRYMMDWPLDDQPVWFRCRGDRRILAVPYPQELNDIPAIVARKENGADFADMIVDQFDEMLELSQARPLVMGVALHPYIVGQPHRLRHLKRALKHIAAGRDGIWLTTPGAIARHCMGLPEGTVS